MVRVRLRGLALGQVEYPLLAALAQRHHYKQRRSKELDSEDGDCADILVVHAHDRKVSSHNEVIGLQMARQSAREVRRPTWRCRGPLHAAAQRHAARHSDRASPHAGGARCEQPDAAVLDHHAPVSTAALCQAFWRPALKRCIRRPVGRRVAHGCNTSSSRAAGSVHRGAMHRSMMPCFDPVRTSAATSVKLRPRLAWRG